MTDYTQLVAVWSTTALPSGVTGTALADGDTADQKLAKVNAWQVAGPTQDVKISDIVGFLWNTPAYGAAAYALLAIFAQAPTNGNQAHDNALLAVQRLMGVLTSPNAPDFRTSKPSVYSNMKLWADGVLAYELSGPTPSTGWTQIVHDGMLALAATAAPWTTSVGLPETLNDNDLAAAGLS